MQTIIYKARSRPDLFAIRDLLSQHGIAPTFVGDPDMSPGPGTKVYYFVELAVDDAQAARAKQIIAEHEAASDDRIRELTLPIRRGVGLAVVFTVLLAALGLIFGMDWMLSALPILFVSVLVALSLISSMKSMTRERRRDRRQCIECGYSLRGN
ncbi:MAG TPA: hypothetical protein PKN33_11480 [Phycisphaerae bacterium]|nr:hypothetical protein [Phycisphaerae bacterium]